MKTLRGTRNTQPFRVAVVPDASVAKAYVHRSFSGMPDFDVFRYALQNRLNVLIEGPTGPGKTMAVRAFAASEGHPFYAIPSNVGLDPTQLFGKYIPNESAVEGDPLYMWQDGPVTDIVRHGGVLLINEVNFMPPRISTAIFSLLDGRREIVLMDHKGEVVRAHMGTDCWCGADDCKHLMVLIVADMNPEYEGTTQLNKAFRNRFPIQLNWDYEPAVEVKLVESDTLRETAAKIRREHQNGTIDTPVSTNMMMEFEKMVKDLLKVSDLASALHFAIENFVMHFAHEERAGIKQVFDAVISNLVGDYTPPVAVPAPSPEVNDDWDFGDAENWVFDRN